MMILSWYKRLRFKHVRIARLEIDELTGEQTLRVIPRNTMVDITSPSRFVALTLIKDI